MLLDYWSSVYYQFFMAVFSTIGIIHSVRCITQWLRRLSVQPSLMTAKMEPSEASMDKFDKEYQDFKMVLVIRTDLEMTKGKIAAQCCHATLATYKYLLNTQPLLLNKWEACGQPKVTLKVKDEKEMIDLMNKARELGLAANSIKDAGRTQIAPGTRTVLAIGPGPISIVDFVTGHLKLY